MKALLADLIALQDVELEVFQAEAGLTEIPTEVEEIESIIQARKRSLDAVDEEIVELNKRKEPLETELVEMQGILDAAETRGKQIKTNKEFLALQREVDVARKRKFELEEQILTLGEKVERRIKDRDQIAEAFDADREVLEAKKQQLDFKLNQLKEVVANHHTEVEKLRKGCDAGLLSRYDRIKANRKGLAVAECVDGVCNGCHMSIPPQLFNELVRGDSLILCPICQRILYAKVEEK